MHQLLIVDDEENILSSVRRSLRAGDYKIETFENPFEALEFLKVSDVDLIMSDYRMPKMDGVQFLLEAKEIQDKAIRIILSGYADIDAIIRFVNEIGIYQFIQKPWHDFDMRCIIEKALMHNDLILENERLAKCVRDQEIELDKRKMVLSKLEKEEPGITKIDWGSNGEIILNEDDWFE